jgi:proteasome lid subunit RPN8/RPN11
MSSRVIPVALTPEMVAEVGRIGELRSPTEACGLVLPRPLKGRWIVELPNRSLEADSYELWSDDIACVLESWLEEAAEQDWARLTVWHTHPAGNVGPSRSDLECKRPEVSYLVVALTPDGPVPTWF